MSSVNGQGGNFRRNGAGDSARDEVRLDYRPSESPQERQRLDAHEVDFLPTHTNEARGGLLRSYFDAETNRTYALATTCGRSKRYLALPQSAWQELLPHLRAALGGDNLEKTIIDLSTRWIIGIDNENGRALRTYQIDPQNDPNRFNALTIMREYLVQRNYISQPLEAIDGGYDSHSKGRATFAAKEARTIDQAELNRRTDEMMRARGENREGNFDISHINALHRFIDEEKAKIQDRKAEIEEQMHLVQRGDLRHIEALNRELEALTYKEIALGNTTNITFAAAMIDEPCDHNAITDWRAPLQTAFMARRRVLDYFLDNARQPISEEDRLYFEQRAADIASLLIPLEIGHANDQENRQSGEAIFRLFYAGTATLSSLVGEDPEIDFAPITPPSSRGHDYLRELIAQFQAKLTQEPPPLPGHDAFFE